jgi:hypothetical protein
VIDAEIIVDIQSAISKVKSVGAKPDSIYVSETFLPEEQMAELLAHCKENGLKVYLGDPAYLAN